MKYTKAEIGRMAAEEYTAYRSRGVARGICKPLDEAGRQEILIAHKQGLFPSEIRTLTGFSKQAIKTCLAQGRVKTGKYRVKQDKIDRVLKASAQGLTQAEIIRTLGYSRSTVHRVLSGKATGYEVDTAGSDVPDHGKTIRISTHPPVGDSLSIETVEELCIRKRQARGLQAVVDKLSTRDQAILQARTEGLSDRQIIVEYHTSRGHLKKLFNNLRQLLIDYK